MRIHALLFFLFLSHEALALYGARPATDNRHLVKLAVAEEVFCQGVAVTATKVLTAGHCIEGMGLKLRNTSRFLTYYPESVTVTTAAEEVRARAITIAPTYFDAAGIEAEDLALIELSRPLRTVEILPLAAGADLVSGAVLLLTAGKKEAPTKLLKKARGLESYVLMSDGSKSGVCQGDSGGAILLVKNGKRYLAGIIAVQAEGCARRHTISYYPRTSF